MPITVEVPNRGSIEFADGTSDADIDAIVAKEFPPTQEDSYQKVLGYEQAISDETPTKDEYLAYLKAKKEKPLLGERPMATLGEAALETGKMLATLPYRTGEAISETAIMPPEGVTRGEAIVGTAAEVAARSETGARRLLGGLQETILSEIDSLAERYGKTLRSDDDKYQAFLGLADVKRKLAKAETGQQPAAQEFLQAYNIPQEAISPAGLEVGGFLAAPENIAFAGGGALASQALRGAARALPAVSGAVQRTGAGVGNVARIPEVQAGRAAAAITGSEAAGQAVERAIGTGTTGVAAAEALGLPVAGNIPIPGAGMAASAIGTAKAVGTGLETIGEAGAISEGQALSPIQRGLLGFGERIAAQENASRTARAFGNILARTGADVIVPKTASILVPALGAGAAGGLLAGLTGEEGDQIAAGIGSGFAFGGLEAGIRMAAAKGVFDANRVRATATEDLNTRPNDVQFTYINPNTKAEQTITIKDRDARAQFYGQLKDNQLVKALSEIANAENAGVEVVFHKDGDPVPQGLQQIKYKGVALSPDSVKSGRPTILVNVDKASPETIPHEILHARITADMVNRIGSQIAEGAIDQAQFKSFANKYADTVARAGDQVQADSIRNDLVTAFDQNLQRAQRIDALRRMSDEFAAYYTQEFLAGKDPKTVLPGRLPSFFEVAFNNAKEAVSEKFTRRALQSGFDPIAKTFYGPDGKRIKIPWMEDAVKQLIIERKGFEPSEQKLDIRKLTPNQQAAVIMSRGFEDLYILNPDGSIGRPKSAQELIAQDADIAQRSIKLLDSLPAADRGTVTGLDSKGNTVIQGRLSLAEADALARSGIYSASTSRYITEIARAIQDGSLLSGSYWKVYGPRGRAGVFGEAQKLFLPYGISLNSAGGVLVKLVDFGRVQARLDAALQKQAYRNLFRSYDQALATLRDVYLKNLADPNAKPSAEALGGGVEGARKRNFFNEVMGAVPKKGDVLINEPTAGYTASRKGGSVYEDYRIERIQNIEQTGMKVPWSGDMGEQSSYRRTQLNFQPAEQVGDTSVQTDQKAGYRILSKNNKFRVYSPSGELAGIFDTEGQAKLKAEKLYATETRLQSKVSQLQYQPRNEGRQAAEAGGGDRPVSSTKGQEESGKEGDVTAQFKAASEADPTQPSTQAIRTVKGQRAVNSLYQFDYTYKVQRPGKPSKEVTATETVSAFSFTEARDKAKKAIQKELQDKAGVLRSTVSISQPTIKGQFAVTELTGKNRDKTVPKIVLNPNNAQQFRSMFDAVDAALELVKYSPTLGLDSDGWIRAFSRSMNGSRASVPPAPLRLAEWAKNNDAFKTFIMDGLQRNPELVKSAVGGLNALQPIHEMARAGMIHPKMVALHMFWGLLSRMLDPYNQEAGWARLTSDPKVNRLIEESVAGRYKSSKDEWKAIVDAKMSEFPDVKVGRNAIQNANAFHEMLSRWNGRWNELTDIINDPNLSGPQMRRKFNEQGFGGAGIKHKVLSFVIATLARNDVFVGDRWQVVNLWFPHLEKAVAARKSAGGSGDVFAYDKNGVPEDTTGAYKVIGGMLNNETVAETAYSLIENGMSKIASESPWLREMLGRDPQPFDIHWLTWNIIKNEPVGHSSLDATAKFLTENLYGDPEFAKKFAETEKRTEKYTKGAFDVFSVKGQERPQISQRPGASYGGPGAPDLRTYEGGGPGRPSGPESARYLPAERSQEDAGRRVPSSRFGVDPATRGTEFADAIRRTKAEHPFGFAVDDKGNEFYTNPGTQLFLSEDGLAGVAVTDYGDLVSVFKHPESTSDIKPLLVEAASKSQTLDAFDVNGFLPNLYGNLGFRPVARVPFNRDYAPPGWRYDLAGEPDVVLMVNDPSGTSGAPQITGKNYSEVKAKVPAVDYDTAVRLQQEAKQRIAESKQGQPQSPEIAGARLMPDASVPGAFSMSGFRVLPGKTKGRVRVYSPTGGLLGIASSNDEAQRMIQRKLR